MTRSDDSPPIESYEESLRSPQVPQDTEDWLEIRTHKVTSTEVSTVLGLNQYQSRADLLQQKLTHTRKPIDNHFVNWGKKYEAISREIYTKLTGKSVTLIGLRSHPIYPRLAASPDGLDVTNQLVEFKNVVTRQITRTIPINYYIQIQIAMEVWNKEICNYFETSFEESEQEFVTDDPAQSIGMVWDPVKDRRVYWRLREHWLQPVPRNRQWFTQECLPHLIGFWNEMNAHEPKPDGVSDGKSHKRKRGRQETHVKRSKTQASPMGESVENPQVHRDVAHTLEQYISPSSLRNWINEDPLIDWLNLYGPPERRDKKSEYSLPALIHQHARELRTQIVHEQFPSTEIRDLTPESIYGQIDPIIKVPPFLPLDKAWGMTQRAMADRVPVIVNPLLVHHRRQLKCYVDLLVLGTHLKYLGLKGSHADGQIYYPVLIKYAKLHLTANGKNLLGENKQKHYRVQIQTILECLENLQERPVCAYLIGRGYSYRSRGISYTGSTPLEKILQLEDDPETHQTIIEALGWHNTIRLEGNAWDPRHPHRSELYPNLKNDQDEPWHTYKHEIGEEIKELTQLWYVGISKRQKLHERGIYRWDQIKSLDGLGIPENYLGNIYNILNANRETRLFGMEQLLTYEEIRPSPVEVYLDFETVTPLAEGPGMIFMIGSLVRDYRGSSPREYHESYQTDHLTLADEHQMVNRWLTHLDELHQTMETHEMIKVYHWSAAESNQIEQYLHRQGRTLPLWLEFIDLCKLFQSAQIGIPRAFSYGLKDISRALHRHGLIQTCWETPMNGLQAMIAVMEADRQAQRQSQTLNQIPLVQEIIRYNYVDCRVMREIMSWIRVQMRGVVDI